MKVWRAFASRGFPETNDSRTFARRLFIEISAWRKFAIRGFTEIRRRRMFVNQRCKEMNAAQEGRAVPVAGYLAALQATSRIGELAVTDREKMLREAIPDRLVERFQEFVRVRSVPHFTARNSKFEPFGDPDEPPDVSLLRPHAVKAATEVNPIPCTSRATRGWNPSVLARFRLLSVIIPEVARRRLCDRHLAQLLDVALTPSG